MRLHEKMGDLCSSLKAFPRAIDFYLKMLTVSLHNILLLLFHSILTVSNFKMSSPYNLVESPGAPMDGQRYQSNIRLIESNVYGRKRL